MKYIRRHNLNPGNVLDNSVLQTADGTVELNPSNKQVIVSGDVSLTDSNETRLRELIDTGEEFAALAAPDALTNGSYILKLPRSAGTTGQLLGTDGNGQLGFYDADTFAGSRIYVSATKGNDLNDGVNAPVKSIKRALQLASAQVYTEAGLPNGKRWNVSVAAGEYIENNPIIVPDNVSVIGDGLRACIIRPANANKDMLRVRNGCYFTEFTFRDGVSSGTTTFTFDYAVSFDDPEDINTSRAGYSNLPNTKPLISTSPYIQNCSLISFLGANGVLVDGNKVITPNTPLLGAEAERPVDIGNGIPEQGKSMVANAFTMLSFGGTGWRIINDAYVQMVSCFQIFMLNGVITQSGGYCSITNSATNFGLYALRASGYSANSFPFDRGYIGALGVNGPGQTLTAFGFTRPNGPVEEFVIKIYDPSTSTDVTNTFKLALPGYVETAFDSATTVIVGAPGVFNIPNHGLINGDYVTYNVTSGAVIGGLFNGESYFINKINDDQFRLCFDVKLKFPVELTSAPASTHVFRKEDYELFVKNLTDSHNTFQTITIDAGLTIAPGEVIEGLTNGVYNSGYAYSYNPASGQLVLSINKVLVGLDLVRNIFEVGSTVTKIGSASANSTVTAVTLRNDLWAATFGIEPTTLNGQLTNLAVLPGKEIRFHRPSITNSSSHTWEYAGSGTDYNALPQNGGQPNPAYEQVNIGAGRVYTSGTNELGDFKVGNFITAFNRTGNIVFRNKVSVNELDALKLSLSDVEITAISKDPNLGEGEIGGPQDNKLSTQKAIWSYANNRLGPFIDKNVSTNAVPGNLVQLNSNGQINRDLLPSQRNFNSFFTAGFNSRIKIVEDVPAKDSQSGDLVTENFEQVELILSSGITAPKGTLIVQETTGARGLLKNDYTNSTTISVASEYLTFEGNVFDLVPTNVLTINGSVTPVYVTSISTTVANNSNYFLSKANSSQFLITANSPTFNFTNQDIELSVQYNGYKYVKTVNTNSLTEGKQVSVKTENFNKIGYVDKLINATQFRIESNSVNSTETGSTTDAVIAPVVSGNITTGTIPAISLTGSISVGDYVFGNADIPVGSRIVAVNTLLDPVTFTIELPETVGITGGSNQSLVFVTPTVEVGKVRSVITSSDSKANGIFEEVRKGVLSSVDALGLIAGSNYSPATGSQTYLRIPLINLTGIGTGAIANITVTNGEVSEISLVRGGTGYVIGDKLSANTANIGGTGSGFEIAVSGIEQRIYIDAVAGTIFPITAGAVDFIEDNNSPTQTLLLTGSSSATFNALPTNIAGGVDYTTSRIKIINHLLENGDPVVYNSAPNVPIGNLTSLSTYYVKVIDSNTIELYNSYDLTAQVIFSSSSSGTHSLVRYNVNIPDNRIYIQGHGLTTGQALRMTGTNLPMYDGAFQFANNSYVFVGGVTANSFTIHELRSDATASVSGQVISPYNITSTGTGNVKFFKNDVSIVGSVNTSSRIISNWGILESETIDAINIVSGIVSPSRLGADNANNLTFLRGDSKWAVAVQSIKSNDSTVLSVSGSGSIPFYGDVTLDISKADNALANNGYSNLGVASFNTSQFYVGQGVAGDPVQSPGQVAVRPGVIDAGTVESRDLEYILDSANHTLQPVTKGGTGLQVYSQGDMLYANGTSSLNTLSIAPQNTVLTSSGTAPQWSSSLNLAGTLSVNGGSILSTTAPFNLLNESAEITAFSAASIVTLGAPTSTTTVSNLTVTGNLTVDGTATVINANVLTVNDNNIELGSVDNFSDTTADGGGVTLKGTSDKTMYWVGATGRWTFNQGIEAPGIQNTPIGLSVKSSGAFTTLTTDAATTFTQNTSSTNTTTGTLVVTGGVGVSENLNVGNTVTSKNLTYTGTLVASVSTIPGTGSVQSDATEITTDLVVVNTAESGSGVRLPSTTVGKRVVIRNNSANDLRIYPGIGAQINAIGINSPFILGTSTTLEFIGFSADQWYTVNATFA